MTCDAEATEPHRVGIERGMFLEWLANNDSTRSDMPISRLKHTASSKTPSAAGDILTSFLHKPIRTTAEVSLLIENGVDLQFISDRIRQGFSRATCAELQYETFPTILGEEPPGCR